MVSKNAWCIFRRFARESSGWSSPPAPARSRVWARTTTIAPLMDALEFSRYARQLVAGRPELREELERSRGSGWTREAMQAFLRERGGRPAAQAHGSGHGQARRQRAERVLRRRSRLSLPR